MVPYFDCLPAAAVKNQGYGWIQVHLVFLLLEFKKTLKIDSRIEISRLNKARHVRRTKHGTRYATLRCAESGEAMMTILEDDAAPSSVSPHDVVVDFDLVPEGEMKVEATPPSALSSSAPSHGTTTTPGTSGRDHDDTGEDRLIADFGPGGLIRTAEEGDGSLAVEATRRVAVSTSSSYSSCFDPQNMLDRRITDEHGLRRRIVYDPTEIARVLQIRHSSSGSSINSSGVCATIDITVAEGSSPTAADSAAALLDRLASTLEMALDPDRPGCESLLICKAVTDAFLVNARRLRGHGATSTVGKEDVKDSYLVRALRVAWQRAVEHWNGDSDEPHSAADLHVTAAWFQAWWAADDTRGGGESTVSLLELYEMLPGDWDWVLDHLETTAPAQG